MPIVFLPNHDSVKENITSFFRLVHHIHRRGKFYKTVNNDSIKENIIYFMLSGRISRNIGENIFRSYSGTNSEKFTDFHGLVA